jgi:hypothetical protein
MKPFKFLIAIIVASLTLTAFAGAAATQEDADNLPHTVSGCLLKRPVNIYLLTDENGKSWDLRSRNVKLDNYVGQTVRATGTIAKENTNGPDTSPQNHLLVTKVEKLRSDCNQQ